MKNLIISIVFLCVFLVGCSDSPKELQSSLDNPTFIGNVNGRRLYMARVNVGGNFNYIYFFRDGTNEAVTVNHKSRKTTTVEEIIP